MARTKKDSSLIPQSVTEQRVEELFGKPIDEMSVEEMQAAVARLQLMREVSLLTQTQQEIRKQDENEAAMKLRNEQRQEELAAIVAQTKRVQRACRHQQGGKHQNYLKGDGKPCVTAAKMLDGFTVRLSCTRCRDEVYTPHPSLKAKDPEAYAAQAKKFEKFLELFEESGLDMIIGPNFTFTKNGVPYIPERV